MESESVKSAYEEIAEQFNLSENPIAYTEANLQRVNDACARLVRRYIEAGEIVIGSYGNSISLYNAPPDILPLIPLCGELGISEYGTYPVMRGLKMLGRVKYNGRPIQDRPGIVTLGVYTSFYPEPAISEITFTLESGDKIAERDGENK